MSVRFADGTQLSCSRDHAKGDREAPLPEGELKTKARVLLTMGGVSDADGFIASILRMAEDGLCPELPLKL